MTFRTTTDTHRAAAALIALLAAQQVKLPPGIAQAVTEAEQATAGLASLGKQIDTDAAASILAATLNGETIPQKQLGRAVAALLTERPGVTHGITYERANKVVAAIKANATDLIEALRPRFDAAAADLDAAADVLQGVDDLSDLAAVTALGGDAAAAWKSAKAAETVITSYLGIIQRLGALGVYEGAATDIRDRLLVIADLDWAASRQTGAHTTPWQLRSLGTLALATPTVHNERQARINAEWSRDPANPATRRGAHVGQLTASITPFGGAL